MQGSIIIRRNHQLQKNILDRFPDCVVMAKNLPKKVQAICLRFMETIDPKEFHFVKSSHNPAKGIVPKALED